MRRRDLLVGAGGLAGSSSLIVGSNAFSSVDADRELQVDIVGDEEAYLALHHHHEPDNGGRRAVTVLCGERVTLFDIQNRFSAPIETLVVSVEDDERFEISVDSDSLGPGDDGQVRLETDFPNGCPNGPFEITVGIGASGDGFSVDAGRDFEIDVVTPQFECLAVIVHQRGNGGKAAESVEFRYRLNVASDVVFEVQENRDGAAGGNTRREQKLEKGSGSVTVAPNDGNFGSPIDILARIDRPGSKQHEAQWDSDNNRNNITLVGGGCSDQG